MSKVALDGERFFQDLHPFAHDLRIEVGGGMQEVDSVMLPRGSMSTAGEFGCDHRIAEEVNVLGRKGV
ncbi:hypothetical protein GGE65_007929 [Skermanella aerolata]|uniref:hypothetical protein n=1 Tax=Skermanella aerolata TaxID=393310 RepID=UPI003D197AB8